MCWGLVEPTATSPAHDHTQIRRGIGSTIVSFKAKSALKKVAKFWRERTRAFEEALRTVVPLSSVHRSRKSLLPANLQVDSEEVEDLEKVQR